MAGVLATSWDDKASLAAGLASPTLVRLEPIGKRFSCDLPLMFVERTWERALHSHGSFRDHDLVQLDARPKQNIGPRLAAKCKVTREIRAVGGTVLVADSVEPFSDLSVGNVNAKSLPTADGPLPGDKFGERRRLEGLCPDPAVTLERPRGYSLLVLASLL
jgi:hypothetical protein